MNGDGVQESSLETKTGYLFWYWFPPIAYAAIIFYLSSLPHPEETLPLSWSFELLGDKVLHMIEYGVFGVLCFRAFRYVGQSWMAHYAWALAIVTATLYGVTDEIHQLYVPFRQSSGLDVLADAIGACGAVLLWRALIDLRNPSSNAAEGYQA